MAVSCNGKVFVVERSLAGDDGIDVYEDDGQLIRSFGEGLFTNASYITAANDGRVMVVDACDYYVHIFNENGDYLKKFKLEGCYSYPSIAFHQGSDHLVVAGVDSGKNRFHVQIYTKDGKFVRSTQIRENNVNYSSLRGMTVSTEGHIAFIIRVNHNVYKVLVV